MGSSAACGGADVAEFVALLTCPPGRSRSLRAARRALVASARPALPRSRRVEQPVCPERYPSFVPGSSTS
jgi:hypothetical protein